ncbi:MAG TPA: hypothetical protein VHD38_00830 [Candidatus Paceibacterota bacterium]|nr:hypothetical protein [Candidatus Paceibacterota bacterium]
MSWAARRQFLYAAGVILFFAIVIGGPIGYKIITKPPTCSDGIQNQGETSIDKGGPCPLVDESKLAPSSVVWSRSFRVRSGSYNAVALIQNPNQNIGIRQISYKFGLYDEQNLLIAERSGSIYIMPGAITPIFEGAIDAGNRVVAHTYFDFTSAPSWEKLGNAASPLEISNVDISDVSTMPRVTAQVKDTSVESLSAMTFVAIVYDPAGNAFAASQTTLQALAAGATADLIFTWPAPFNITVGRIQVIPLVAPVALQ